MNSGRIRVTRLYLDTSVVVASLTKQDATARVQSWLPAQDRRRLISSVWLATEVRSALSLLFRRGMLSRDEQASARATADRFIVDLEMMEIDRIHFRAAADLCDDPALALKAPDALHVAICADRRLTLVTLDKTMAAAARAIGVAVEQP